MKNLTSSLRTVRSIFVADLVAARANNRFKLILKPMYYTARADVATYYAPFIGAFMDILVTPSQIYPSNLYKYNRPRVAPGGVRGSRKP